MTQRSYNNMTLPRKIDLYFSIEEMKTFLEERGYFVKRAWHYTPGGNHEKTGTEVLKWYAWEGEQCYEIEDLFLKKLKEKLLSKSYDPTYSGIEVKNKN